ncbi:hydantoinase/oxoprolinase family protein [Streptomyces sp. NPDC058665]|uniref:hydantoinase/oxoprolinase family protein n=1 Tax=Streptomyces sp. NPDC058665 TaxID=3346586 RepID=UPI003662468B
MSDDEMATDTRAGVTWLVAADIGGTFTDLIALSSRGEVVPMKVLSTPPDFESGVLDGLGLTMTAGSIAPDAVSGILHATTVATNTILEGRGSRTALITTSGFRDVLELGRLRRPLLYDLSWRKPVPLARRRHRYEVRQRIAADGSILREVAVDEVGELAEQLRRDGIEAVAVCLINSHVRPDQERLVTELLRSHLPDVYATASVDLSPEAGEFERSSTAVVNSYVGPVVRDYVRALVSGLRSRGVGARLAIMQSSGGLLDAQTVVERPAQIIESGPAAGVIAVQKLARLLELQNVVAFDMGGTTAKASLIENGQPFVATDYEVGGGMNITRSMGKGAGYALRVPSIDIAEVGAGGGSIIGVDAAGVMHVGPESAGSRPGPACYGQGGTQPTLTDANVVLGYINPGSIAGGRVEISPALARQSVEPAAETIGVTVEEAAQGAYAVAVSNMVKAVKAVTSERGRDPRAATMVAFGGAGPLYGAAIARELGIEKVVVPVHTGLFSSIGLLVADTELEMTRPFHSEMSDPAVLGKEFDELSDGVVEALRLAGAESGIETERILDMRYRGQRFELRVPLVDREVDDALLKNARADFHAEHLRTYGREGTDDLVEIVNLRVKGFVPNPISIDEALRLPSEGAATSARNTRPCYFNSLMPTPVVERAHLSGVPEPGPLIIEDMDSTTVVPPGASARLDSHNNVIVTWTKDEDASR